MSTESKLQRLFRKRFESQRKRLDEDETPSGKGSRQRNDSGVGVTGVVVTIVILAILAAVGGPPLFSLIFDAREFKLENNVQEAAQIVQQRLTLEPDWMGDDGVHITGTTVGQPKPNLITTLVEDAPYAWETSWALLDTDNDETIRVQFLKRAANLAGVNAAGHTIAAAAAPAAAGGAGAPIGVDWVSGDWRAVRLHARNSDGRWACALIVVQANADGVAAGTDSRYESNALPAGFTLTTAGTEAARTNSRLMNAWLSGIWYDSGDVVTAGGGLHDCSPVDLTVNSAGSEKASFPESADEWAIDDAGTSADPIRTFRRAL